MLRRGDAVVADRAVADEAAPGESRGTGEGMTLDWYPVIVVGVTVGLIWRLYDSA